MCLAHHVPVEPALEIRTMEGTSREWDFTAAHAWSSMNDRISSSRHMLISDGEAAAPLAMRRLIPAFSGKVHHTAISRGKCVQSSERMDQHVVVICMSQCSMACGGIRIAGTPSLLLTPSTPVATNRVQQAISSLDLLLLSAALHSKALLSWPRVASALVRSRPLSRR